MAQQDYNESPLPIGSNNKRQNSNLLPNFFRSNSNKKFLGGTVDVVTQPGTLTRISSYIGRRDIPNYSFDDNYIEETSTPRQYYQLEPAFINQDSVTGNINWFGDYIDYINSLKYFGANVSNHSKLNKQEAYTWDPHIDWDKFVNYREYFWLPSGPDPITVYGHLENIVSEYSVTSQFEDNNIVYIFTPDGLTANPALTLYRGVTYTFNINAPNTLFSIKTQNESGDSYFYDIGVSARNVEKGILTFTVPYEAPDMLYYVDNTVRENNGVLDETVGIINIKDIKDAAFLDVEKEIVGKINFTTSDGIQFINGLVVQFSGQVTPTKYASGQWYVEGVGSRIVLINKKDLESPATFISNIDIPFDDQGFDTLPWENADNYPLEKDYLVINRASRDRNNWSRTNRWFHRSVIEISATANGTIPLLDQTTRALRPIIEFEPDLKLYNHGYFSKADIDLVDTVTTDVFSLIEGSTGYFIDGIELLPGYRVLFLADNDILVKGKIFEVQQIQNVYESSNQDIVVISTAHIVNSDQSTKDIITVPDTNTLKPGMTVKFSGNLIGGLSPSTVYYILKTNFTSTSFSVGLTANGSAVTLIDSTNLTMKVSVVGSGVTRRKQQLTLQEVPDTDPVEGEIVYITKGNSYMGSSFYYLNGTWAQAQKKTAINQAPLFDLFDENFVSYSDTTVYPYNNFKGTKIFNYQTGTGINDSELGFPLVYRSIDNVGDIEFEFSLEKDTWKYTLNKSVVTLNAYQAFLRKWNLNNAFEYKNGWIETDRKTEQNVVRVLKVESATSSVPIDVYDDAQLLYALEQANQILSTNQFYISIQDNLGRDLTNTDYWLPFNYNTSYQGIWKGIGSNYHQRDIVLYNNFFYIALEDIMGNSAQVTPQNTNYWKLLFTGYIYKGEFNLIDSYFVDDIISYKGSVYIAIQDNIDHYYPTDIIYWKILIKGQSQFRGEYNTVNGFFKGQYSSNQQYVINDIIKLGSSYYIALRNNISIGVTDTNNWKLINTNNVSNFNNMKMTVVYNNKDIVSYGLYLYVSNVDNNTASPTDLMYWTQLSSGSVFPKYYNNQTLYREGTIVVPDVRTKVDYRIRVYVNDIKRSDLNLGVTEGIAYINFGTPLAAGDKVVYKIRSISNKNLKGYYEIPLNWQNNPFNKTVDNFTFGESIDHVRSIVENSSGFSGNYPGLGNLSELGNVSNLGRKFMQHSGPLSLSAFLMIDKNVNIVKTLQWASKEYTQFKKDTIFRLETKGFDGTPREIADQVLLSYSQSKYLEKSPFYYSDMVPFGAASVRQYTVDDPRFPVFIIDSIFNPKTQTKRSILIYVNEEQLIYDKDYTFDTTDAFVTITSTLSVGDQVLIKDYASTDGCYVPLTPSKLGLYPLYEPMIYIDDTHRTIVQNFDGTESPAAASITVIQGHDGSIFTAYGDYRDDVILEIEKRIFNNVRVNYDPDIFDINDVLTGYYRRTDFTKSEINDILITEFLRWNSVPEFDFNSPSYTVPGDLTPRYQWIDGDPFTYNYNKSMAPNGIEFLYGYWRGVYKYFFDTDRPHSHPWEMQGFSIKPTWWETIYGQAPYTSENKIMWDSIEKGIINDPKGRSINLKFARPGLGNYLPVDDAGNLISPFESGLSQNFSKSNSQGRYTFGDQAPVETAWRRSNEYPFAVMIAMCVLRGSEFIGKMWDRFTIKRNIAGQIYSTITNKKLNTAELVFANELQSDGTRTITNGLTNFIDEYIFVNTNIDYNYYKSLIRGLDAKLRYRLGGFSSKEKIKILLDSRTPNSSGTIFLPNENYKIFYNKSAPVETVNYSGVIIEKRTDGYSVKGYDIEKYVFEIFPPRTSSKDPVINVGGISESYIEWSSNQYYTAGQLVKIDSLYYRTLISHTSSSSADIDIAAKKFQLLPSLPITGGRDAYVRQKFINVPIKVPYGTVFTDIQSVVDFLLGYQERLRDLGFQFDDYSSDLQLPLNWLTSAKEFMFWTLQNWIAGSVITLSPAANNLKYSPNITASVDTLNSEFYGYSIFKADGSPLLSDLTDIYREDNGFTIQPTIKTADGIYNIRTSLVYQEHVIIFDNISVFGDIVYDVIPGYRQGRLKLVGFKTNNWDGSYYSPGFMYDNADVQNWQPNIDYNIGDVINYKNSYYTALERIYGTTTFDYTKWSKLSSKPTPKLEPNLDYRIEQFRDFYSLESSNFDESQVNLARHLVGYQKRQYLEDIIVDDVSQYKFYQGYIKEKGTLNSVTKLFDALRSSGYSTLDLKEEWAFKVADFGASDAYTELEFILDETKFLHNPQDIVLSLGSKNLSDLSIYNLTISDVVKKYNTYDANPFVTTSLDFNQKNYGVFKYRVAGYVNPNDVDLILYDEPSLLNYNHTLLKNKDKIWIGNTPNGDWNVMGYYDTKSFITSWERQGNLLNLYLSFVPMLSVGDIIVVKNIDLINGVYKVISIYAHFIQVFTSNNLLVNNLVSDSTHGVLFKFESVRYKNPESIDNSLFNNLQISGEKIWIDQDSLNEWKVLENSKVFKSSTLTIPIFLRKDNVLSGHEIKISQDNKFLFVSYIGYQNGTVIVYTRPNNTTDWVFLQSISMPTDFNVLSGTEKFGTSIDISSDGMVLVISAPDLSNIKSHFTGDFSVNGIYNTGDVVRYNNQLWIKINPDVDGTFSKITDSSHNFEIDGGSSESYPQATIDGGNSVFQNSVFSGWQLLSQVFEVSEESYISGLNKQGAVFVYNYNIDQRQFNRDSYVYEKTLSTVTSIIGTSPNYYLTCDSTSNLTVGQLIKFIGTTFGGIDTSTIYYVSSISNETQFNISLTSGGSVLPLTSGSGSMTVTNGAYIAREQIICSYNPIANERFGTKVKISKVGSEYWLYVSSEQYLQSGSVQVFRRDSTGAWNYNLDQQFLNFNYINDGVFPSPYVPGVGDLYGYDLQVYNNFVIVSAPFINGGAIYIFEKTSTIFSLIQVIDKYTIENIPGINSVGTSALINDSDNFGYSISMKGSDLFVSSPNNDVEYINSGIIYKFEYTEGVIPPFTVTQLIYPPLKIQNERFGIKIDTNSDQSILVVSSAGGNVTLNTTFDVHIDRLVFNYDSTRNYTLDPNSSLALVSTSFDQGATGFYDSTPYTGSVYAYNSFDNKFVYADYITPLDTLVTADNFGLALAISNDCLVIGAPNHSVNGVHSGSTYIFDYNTPSWKVIASGSNVVDVSKFKKAFIYNTNKNVLIEELDFIDPLKGYIAGPANQEITYQTMRDPASYDYTNYSQTLVDKSSPWRDDHIGEVWWDLSTVKWIWYEQGDSSFRNTYWNTVFPGSTIDVYEWTETTLLPSQWVAATSGTNSLANGFSGVPAYTGDLTYSTKQKYDPISGVLTTYYYYWVKNKVTIPNVHFRSMSVYDVARLILDPSAEGYKFIAITGSNSFSLVNVKPDIYHRDVNLNLQFYEIDNTDLIVHREYALIAEGDPFAIIPTVIETKWIDSLCGTNVNGGSVPDTRLSKFQRYGASNEPRQTWFVNRYEALKQYFEYVNSILLQNQIADKINFVNLLKSDLEPDLNSGKIDQIVDILDDLRFIGTAKLRAAVLSPVIKDGQIIRVTIVDSGYGYKVAPAVQILGVGTGAKIKLILDSNGSVSAATVIKRGHDYDTYSTKIYVRNYTVLIRSDSDALGGWTLHDWFSNTGNIGTYYWRRIKTQGWNVQRYWNYADWYAKGYSSESNIKFQVDRTVNLEGLQSSVGDLVKVTNVSNNWLLLQRVSSTENPDYTQVYEVVGKQNGTIQFSDKLYNLNSDLGFDTIYSYDNSLYDQGPSIELRIILESIRDNILINELRVEYISTFFNSVNYSLHEQLYVDWVFKTSFLKINHNAGTLKQRITYQSDVLPSYQKYIEEVKPYKSKIREMLDSYNYTDPAYELTTDFDLFSYYDSNVGKIIRGSLTSSFINTYPWKSWYDNYKYGVIEIKVYDQGDGYKSIPDVIITGDGTGAKATAYIAKGKLVSIEIDNPGTGYTYAPTIFISGGNAKGDPIAKAVAIIGNNQVRTTKIGIKYDRISPNYTIQDFYYTDTFSGTGSLKSFKLTFAPDPKKVNFNILVNNIEIYGSLYSISIVQNLHDTYSALEGYVVFKTAPSYGVNNITISYKKNIQLFDSADRINYGYSPTEGMLGNELGLLMTGVDYSGVQLTSIDFNVGGGWDVIPWDSTSWDNVINSTDDFVVIPDHSTVIFTLPYVPKNGEIINIYVNGIRVDDLYYSHYDGSTVQPNGLTSSPKNTIMDTFVGDGIKNQITLPHAFTSNDTITFRKSTSDGAILPADLTLIDSLVDGGDLAYTTASGVSAEEIIIDGDGFVTSDTSYGPEELVQGQVVDTLEINVYHTPSSGGPNVIVHNFLGDGVNSSFTLPSSLMPKTREGALVTVGNRAIDLAVDYKENKITILSYDFTTGQYHPYIPDLGAQIAITSVDTAGYDIADQVSFIGDGSTKEFLTSARYNNGNVTPLVILNGEYLGYEILNTNYAQGGDTVSIILSDSDISSSTDYSSSYSPTDAPGAFISIVDGTGIEQFGLIEYYDPKSKIALVVKESFIWFPVVQCDNIKFIVDSTATLSIGMPIIISKSALGPSFAGVNNNTVYYVTSDNFTSTTFSISLTLNGPPILLSQSSGVMLVKGAGWDTYAQTISPTLDSTTKYIIQVQASSYRNSITVKNSTIAEYGVPGDVVIEFEKAPGNGDKIVIMIFNGLVQKFSRVFADTIPIVPGQYQYTLNRVPANAEPLSASIFVLVDSIKISPDGSQTVVNEFVQAPAYKYFTYEGIDILDIQEVRFPPNSLVADDISLYLNGVQLVPVRDYYLDSNQVLVNLTPGVAKTGDEIIVEITKLSDYKVIGDQLIFNKTNFQIQNQILIVVNTFTNHDIVKFRRSSYGFKFTTGYDVLQYEFTQYDILSSSVNTSGIFDLPRLVSSKSSCLVSLNRRLLIPNVDYVILDNLSQVKVLLPDILNSSGYIEILTVNDRTVRPSFGFKIFKDMLNRTIYKRIDSSSSTYLKQDFMYLDTQIVVNDTTKLQLPTPNKNLPGVIEIEGERIEYFSMKNNTLSQLRRATLGTGAKNYYSIGTEVSDVGQDQTVPYSDQEDKITYFGDNHTTIFNLDFTPKNSSLVKWFSKKGFKYIGNYDYTLSYSNGDIVVYNGIYYTAIYPTIVVTGSTTKTNIVICSSTATLSVGTSIIFGSKFGNVNAGQIYYVYSILSDTEFTITDQQDGKQLVLTAITQNVILNTIPSNALSNQSSFWQEYAQVIDINWYINHTKRWYTAQTYSKGTIVWNNGIYYQAIKDVQTSIDITDTNYWVPYNLPILDTDWYRDTINVVSPANLVVGQQYTITDIGLTNWSQVGVPTGTTPVPGLTFIATATTPTNSGSHPGLVISSGIPVSYGQCDQIEVYVGGRRLIKNPYIVHNYTKSIDSYQGTGDITLQAEFAVSGIDNTIKLSTPPAAGELVIIIYKTGRIWKKRGESVPLVYSQTDIAQFLTARPAILPK